MLPSSVNPNGVLEAIALEPTAARLAPASCCQSLQSWRLEVALPTCEEAAVLPAHVGEGRGMAPRGAASLLT